MLAKRARIGIEPVGPYAYGTHEHKMRGPGARVSHVGTCPSHTGPRPATPIQLSVRWDRQIRNRRDSRRKASARTRPRTPLLSEMGLLQQTNLGTTIGPRRHFGTRPLENSEGIRPRTSRWAQATSWNSTRPQTDIYWSH